MNIRKVLLLSVFTLAAPLPAEAAICNVDVFGNGVCDCGCGDVDPDCPSGSTFVACDVSHCAAGEVPWEHSPHTCMDSACGDGWNDPVMGETCDDGNALDRGGCAASCQATNPGYECGPNARGCAPAAGADAGTPDTGAPIEVDAGEADAGVVADAGTTPDTGVTTAPDAGTPPTHEDTDEGGCSGGSSATHVAAAGGALLLARRRRRTTEV